MSSPTVRPFFFLLVLATFVFWIAEDELGAQAPDWRAHTPMRQITSLDVTGEHVWAATLGGVFSYRLDGGEIQRFTTVQGLHGIDARALAVGNSAKQIWIGYGDGTLDLLETESGTVRPFLDISRADQFQSRGILHLEPMGDSLLALTEFGVVVFDTRLMEVRDAYTRIGTWPAATPVYDVLTRIADGVREIWIASSRGVAHAIVGDGNLQEPSAWTVETGLSGRRTNALAEFGGEIYAATATDVLKLSADGSWSAMGFSGNEVFDLIASPERLVAAEEFSLVSLDASGNRTRRFLFTEGPLGDPVQYLFPRHLQFDAVDRVWVGDEREGLVSIANLELQGETVTATLPVVPDGPQNGLFTDIVSGLDGDVWVAGAPGNGTGFHRLNSGIWTDFTSRTRSELKGLGSYDHIHADGQGNVWAGSAGKGLTQLRADGVLTIFNQDNSFLRAAAGTDEYVRVLGMATDPDGTFWAINEFSPLPLVSRTSGGDWGAIPAVRASGAPASLSYRRIYIDTFGQKWLLCDRSQGMVVFDSGDDPGSNADDNGRYIRGRGAGGQGLPNETVTAWAQDGFGNVWIGTERGIASTTSPGLVLFDDPTAAQFLWPTTGLDSGQGAYLLRDLFVNDLYVDPANDLWIASKSGIWKLRAYITGGADILEHYTTDNSPLFSNDVIAVGGDDRSGRVFFATNKGMLSLQGSAVAPSTELRALSVFPNPALFGPGGIGAVTIDGLVSETDVRIVTVSGTVIREIEGRGGRVVWDGMTNSGQEAPSAVYIVTAVGKNGEGTAYGKIALIR